MSDSIGVRSGPWPAPAKLNLFLHVLGRRRDGYHRLQTVFQFLEYSDQLWFTVTQDPEVRLLTPFAGISEGANLLCRAARALQDLTGCRLGVMIEIDKRLPIGGGLGGGSSDAATTLVALNRLWTLGLDPAELARIGLSLGADVPVFVSGQAAWAEGVGERLTPVSIPEPWYVVVQPDCPVSTAEVFADPELTRDTPPTTIAAYLAGQTVNDCQPVVAKRYPEVRHALCVLNAQAPARLTGTGGCVFAAFSSEYEARKTLVLVREEGLSGFVALGCNRSPLKRAHDWTPSG